MLVLFIIRIAVICSVVLFRTNDDDDDYACGCTARGKVAEEGPVPVKSRFVRGVGTASEASRATQVGVACQMLRPAAATLYDSRPPTLPAAAAQFLTQL